MAGSVSVPLRVLASETRCRVISLLAPKSINTSAPFGLSRRFGLNMAHP